MTDTPIFQLENVGVDYPLPAAQRGSVTGLDEVDLTIPGSGLTVLAGPSGSGKSTLLRVLSLFQTPTRGRVVFAGTPVSPSPRRRRALRRDSIGLVFQTPTDNLLPHLSVADNLHAAAQSARRRCDPSDLLDRLGLGGTERWRIGALSGGQQQRLAFACVLARGCPVVLADEPTSQLDDASAAHVLDAIALLQAEGVAVVVSSHDERLVEQGSRVFRLRAGRVVEEGN
ncbi:ABC transporter ATP-binding protein [Saccharomonospora viridis]|uniref:ABC-type antimicrobial peptide transport system, ATPase component n=2 Tax=Saccharomonospora viridis TaxID=1852 RepID=C7MWT7_SACVD|nr:ATP-binding cassette domain-containing protein [Saccharomonospora viridis]ACU97191.1 ABC-type antimicrobial peptide transport system, ATPase component [Saccharomonospora viridis DSM 43017]KHF43452.1 ABC transporter ATP-binding protein [Saccharomonospora viridis]SFO78888.1 ABC transporter [Saccharomonospora viridis]